MNNIIYAITAIFLILVSVGLMYLYLTFQEKEIHTLNNFFVLDYEKKYCLLAVIMLVIAITVFLYSHYYVDHVFLKAFMNAEVMIWLIVIGYIDWKEGIIPNQMVLTGIIFWAVLSLIEIFIAHTMWQKLLFFSLIGGGFCGGILLLVAIITKGALGMGDVKMFFVIGLLYGLSNTYTILFFTILVMAIVSIFLLAMKKVTKKTAVPMAPFVTIGFLINVLMGM